MNNERLTIVFCASMVMSHVNPDVHRSRAGVAQATLPYVQGFSTGGSCLNFAGFPEEGASLIRASFGGNYARLVEAKNAYDPANMFRLNNNIKPTV